MRELAATLRVSTSTVYQAVAAGEIPHVRVSNAIRIPVVCRATLDPEERTPDRCQDLVGVDQVAVQQPTLDILNRQRS